MDADEKLLAPRRMRYLTQYTAGKVIAHSCYWNRPFLVLYLERTEQEIASDPDGGYLFACHGPDLVRCIARKEKIGPLTSELVHALALLGSAALAIGEKAQAQACFGEARELAKENDISPASELLFIWRYAAFRHAQGLETAEIAARGFSLPREKVNHCDLGFLYLLLAEQKLSKGKRGGEEFSEALLLATGKTAQERRFRRELLMRILSAVRDRGLLMTDQQLLFSPIEHLRKEHLRNLDRTDSCLLFWIAGLIHEKHGLKKIAHTRLRRSLSTGQRAKLPHLSLLQDDLNRVLRDLSTTNKPMRE